MYNNLGMEGVSGWFVSLYLKGGVMERQMHSEKTHKDLNKHAQSYEYARPGGRITKILSSALQAVRSALNTPPPLPK